MSAAVSKFDLLQAVRAQSEALASQMLALNKLIDAVGRVMDGSEPDPILSAPLAPPATLPLPLAPIATEVVPARRDQRVMSEARRTPVYATVAGVRFRTTERRATLLDALLTGPMSLKEMHERGLSTSVEGVKVQIIDINKDLRRAGLALRVRTMPRDPRLGVRGGSEPARYALLPPIGKKEHLTASFPGAQHEGADCERQDSGSAESASGEVTETSAQAGSFVMSPGAGEEGPASVDPAPSADDENSPDRANEIAGEPTTDNPGHMHRLPDLGPVGREGCEAAQLGPSTCDEPSGADTGSAVGAGAPYISGKEKALNLWASSALSLDEIATAARITRRTVKDALATGRKAGDPRALARDDAPTSAAPTQVTHRSGNLPSIEPGDLIAVDVKHRLIVTPTGSYELASVRHARAMEKMKRGELFGWDVIVRVAGWDSVDSAQTSLGGEKARLAEHGLEFWHDRFNVRLRRATA